MLAFLKFLHCCASKEMFNRPNAQRGQAGRFFAGTQMLCFIDLVVEAIKHEINQVGNYSLCSFCLQKLNQVVIAGRGEFHQNLAYDTYTWFLDILERYLIKVSDNPAA